MKKAAMRITYGSFFRYVRRKIRLWGIPCQDRYKNTSRMQVHAGPHIFSRSVSFEQFDRKDKLFCFFVSLCNLFQKHIHCSTSQLFFVFGDRCVL